MSCHRKVTHYRDGFGVKNKWTETCGLLSLLHLGLLFCHINIRTGPHYTPLPRCDGSAGSAPRAVLGSAGEPHPGDRLPAAPPGNARDPLSPAPGQRILWRDPAPPPPRSQCGVNADSGNPGDTIHFCRVLSALVPPRVGGRQRAGRLAHEAKFCAIHTTWKMRS